MQYFCAVAEQGQISRAARVLNIAQPPLSQRMRELEEELGCALFLREGRSIRLTPAGELFHRRAREILRSVEATCDDVMRLALPGGPALRIGLSPTCRNYWLRHFRKLGTRIGGRQIGLTVSDSSTLEYLLQAGQLDLALMQAPLHPEHFTLIELFRSPTVAVTAKGLLGARTRRVTAAMLGRHPLLMLRRSLGSGGYERLLHALREAGQEARIVLYSSDVAMLLELLPDFPDGIAIVPASETGNLPEPLRALPVEIPLPEYSFSLVSLAAPENTALLEEFVRTAATMPSP